MSEEDEDKLTVSSYREDVLRTGESGSPEEDEEEEEQEEKEKDATVAAAAPSSIEPLTLEGKTKKTAEIIKVDVGTQTEEEYFETRSRAASEDMLLTPPRENIHSVPTAGGATAGIPVSPPGVSTGKPPLDALTARLFKLPLISRPVSAATGYYSKTQPQQSHIVGDAQYPARTDAESMTAYWPHPLSPMIEEDEGPGIDGEERPLYTPQIVESTHRLAKVYNSFDRSKILQRFNKEYPEMAPDLRKYSIRDGRRHVIHGSHAYYFH